MNETVWMIAGLAVVLLIVVLYMAMRDKETMKKIAMLEAGIDGMGRELFRIEKSLESLEKEFRERMDTLAKQSPEPEISVDREVAAALEPFVIQLHRLQESVDTIREELEGRLERLDGKVRQVAFAADHMVPNEQKILQLHAQGLDSETIAKQLRMGKGEVELVLKFSKIHA